MDFEVFGQKIGRNRLFLIGGPCVIESEEIASQVACFLKNTCERLRIPFVFKSSYDKANRTSGLSYRGPGLDRGLGILADIRDKYRIPVLTDVHAAADVEPVSQVVDILQIPAFLARQTDLVMAAGRTGKPVNLKKAQFLSPHDMGQVINKVKESGNEHILLTERGSQFGYNNLVVDMRSLAILRKFAPVVFDATHSVQLPSAQADEHGPAVSGGQPEFIPVLARAAVAAGVDGVFLEVHDNPKEAKSDGANALESTKLREVLKELLAVRKALDVAWATP